MVANIIDVGIKNGDLAYIGKQCGLMVLLAVVGMASSLTAQYFAAKAALGYGTALRGALFRHIDTLSYTELDGIGTPTLVTRMTSDVNQLQNGVNMTLRLLLRCPFIVIGALILAFVISPTMGFWFVLVTLGISLVVWLIMRVTVPQYRAAQNTLDKVTLLTRENYVGARVVRAFARQDDEIADFTAVNDKLKTFQLIAGRISALMTPLTYLIVNLGVIAILMRGGLQVNSGRADPGRDHCPNQLYEPDPYQSAAHCRSGGFCHPRTGQRHPCFGDSEHQIHDDRPRRGRPCPGSGRPGRCI